MRKKISQFIGTKSQTFLQTNFEKSLQYPPSFLSLTLIRLIDLPVNQFNKQLSYFNNYTHHIVWRLL